jgi:hypothetical protein
LRERVGALVDVDPPASDPRRQRVVARDHQLVGVVIVDVDGLGKRGALGVGIDGEPMKCGRRSGRVEDERPARQTSLLAILAVVDDDELPGAIRLLPVDLLDSAVSNRERPRAPFLVGVENDLGLVGETSMATISAWDAWLIEQLTSTD